MFELPQCIDATTVAVELIDNIQVVNELGVTVDSSYFGIPGEMAELTPKQTVL
jgi:hypothetical protein